MGDYSGKTLYLIDGSGFIFRAYYAIRTPMTAPDGTPTNAVFGFTRLLLNLLKDENPSHVAVIFDAKRPSFREEIYPEYKANRVALPEDMIPQFGLCREVTRALGLPALELARYEADDLIGTLSKRFLELGGDCVVVSADKDLLQLVSPHLTVWDGKETHYQRDEVIAKFGVPPEVVPDWLGLAGDTADNIPGVRGVGPKTASKLLNEYGNMESLLEHAHEIKGKLGQSLVECADNARLSKKLATLAYDAPIEIDFENLKHIPPNPSDLYDFLAKVGFKSFVKSFGLEAFNQSKSTEVAENQEDSSKSLTTPAPSAPKAPATDPVSYAAYRTISTEEELAALLKTLSNVKKLSVDLETSGLSPLDAHIVGFALAWAPGQAAYIPVAHETLDPQLSYEKVLEALRPILEDPRIEKCGQNVKYEYQVFRQAGVAYAGVTADSMLQAYLLEPGERQFNLDTLSEKHLNHKMISFHEVTQKSKEPRFAEVPTDRATTYACEDADVALQLCAQFAPALESAGLTKLEREVELPLAELLARMELQGIHLEGDILRAQSPVFKEKVDSLASEIYALAGHEFLLESPKQLSKVLFEELELPHGKKSSQGQFSTDQSVLEGLAEEFQIAEKILEYRRLSKLKSTYIDTLPGMIHPKTGRVHTSYFQAVTATGRLASRDPNLQNIPVRSEEGKAIRRAFTAEPGWKLLSADYSQIELRLLAHFSEDPGLCGAFKSGEDVHRHTASELFQVPKDEVTSEQRRRAKALGFGLMYGMSAFRLSNELGCDRAFAKEIINRYFERYQGIRRYFEQATNDARATHCAHTMMGRIRQIPDINSTKRLIREAAERLAVNTPIQGSAADILKVAMLNIDRRLRREKLDARMLLTVHDEVVLEVPERELLLVPMIVEEEMTHAVDLRVPLEISMGIGDNWAEIH